MTGVRSGLRQCGSRAGEGSQAWKASSRPSLTPALPAEEAGTHRDGTRVALAPELRAGWSGCEAHPSPAPGLRAAPRLTHRPYRWDLSARNHGNNGRTDATAAPMCRPLPAKPALSGGAPA
uniref:Uncharacterized protein n=1 Tax=Pipistrellus kuhlii TaxID=59472 RepID=A0A7J7WDH1_PIPKU|nr:hypothetical protein mPipKuh1_008094 [Pipistrellus kuhlii]